MQELMLISVGAHAPIYPTPLLRDQDRFAVLHCGYDPNGLPEERRVQPQQVPSEGG
jgi:hypothetical protein